MTRGGFTLLEMIVALTILAIVMAVVAPALRPRAHLSGVGISAAALDSALWDGVTHTARDTTGGMAIVVAVTPAGRVIADTLVEALGRSAR